jgi:predicted amidohydrolase
VGEDGNGVAYPGSSQLIDPAGEVLLAMGDEEETSLVVIDLEKVRAIQKSFPFQPDADSFELLK